MEFITQIMTRLLWSLPMLLVYGAGAVLAIVFWKRCPRACLLALIACLVLIAGSLFSNVASTWLFWVAVRRYGWSSKVYTAASTVISIAGTVIHAGGIGLLLAAVFAGRPRPAEVL